MTPNSDAIEQLNTLTPAHQQQVIDFIAFLKTREQVKTTQPIAEAMTDNHSRLQREQGVLVIDTGATSEFDINAFIGELREERIQTLQTAAEKTAWADDPFFGLWADRTDLSDRRTTKP
jgi:hypothetical protein